MWCPFERIPERHFQARETKRGVVSAQFQGAVDKKMSNLAAKDLTIQ
jgi:hypothetical protein